MILLSYSPPWCELRWASGSCLRSSAWARLTTTIMEVTTIHMMPAMMIITITMNLTTALVTLNCCQRGFCSSLVQKASGADWPARQKHHLLTDKCVRSPGCVVCRGPRGNTPTDLHSSRLQRLLLDTGGRGQVLCVSVSVESSPALLPLWIWMFVKCGEIKATHSSLLRGESNKQKTTYVSQECYTSMWLKCYTATQTVDWLCCLSLQW